MTRRSDSGSAQHSGGTYCGTGAVAEGATVTPPERALMVAYHGVGLSYTEIATRLGRDIGTVNSVLGDLRAAAREAEDPLDVFADAVGPALATDPDCGGAP